MLTISKNELMERWDSIPQSLRDALWSEYNADILWETCKKEHLSEDKTAIVAKLAGDVIMGFLLPEDLSKEIARDVEINQGIADAIAQEVETKILRPIMDEIREVYSPPTEKVETGSGKKENVIQLEGFGEEKPAAVRVGVETEKVASTGDKAGREGQPLIIHKEEGQEAATEEKKFKGFDFPFGIFEKKEGTAATGGPVKVRIESPGMEKQKKPEKRVVHYSEYRTPLTPFGRPEEEIIDIPTLTRKEPPPKVTPKPASEAKLELPKQPALQPEPDTKKEESKGPSVEGNMIDLKNL